MKNLLIMQQNEFLVKYQCTLQQCSHCVLMLTNSSQVISKYVSQPHILVYMLNKAPCRTCPEAELTPVSPTVKPV